MCVSSRRRHTICALVTGVQTCALPILLAIPLSGWAFNSASNFALRWFGWFNLPRLVAADPGLKAFFHEAHEWLFWLLVVVVLVHAGAALKHHWMDRDDVLTRMLPWLPTNKDRDDA